MRSLVVKGDVVADIGAKVGVYTNQLSLAVGAHGKVFSFESLSDNYETLTTLVLKARLDNVSSYRLAVGSRSTRDALVITETDHGRANSGLRLTATPAEAVNVTTLDELYRDNTFDRLNFIKCDVEGAELDVIIGGLDIICSQVPSLLIKVRKQASDPVFELLYDLGYRAGFVSEGKMIESGDCRAVKDINCFFFHPRSAAWSRR